MNQEKKQRTDTKIKQRAITLQVAIDKRPILQQNIGRRNNLTANQELFRICGATNIIFVDIPEFGSGNILLDRPCHMILMLYISICCH